MRALCSPKGKCVIETTVTESQFSFDAHNDPAIAGNVDGIGNLKEFSIPEMQQSFQTWVK